MEELFRVFLLRHPYFDENAVRRDPTGKASLCDIISQLTRVQNRSVRNYMRNHSIENVYLDAPDITLALLRWPNLKARRSFRVNHYIQYNDLLTIALQRLRPPVAPVALVAFVVPVAPVAPVAPGPQITNALVAPIAPVAPVAPVAMFVQPPGAVQPPPIFPAVPEVEEEHWILDEYFIQDNGNFLVVNNLPFTIVILINGMCFRPLEYNLFCLRNEFIKKIREQRNIYGTYDFIHPGMCHRLCNQDMEIIFKFISTQHEVIYTPGDIGINVPICCSVCMEDVRPIEPILLLECLHIFHKSCLDKWKRVCFSGVPTCPNCREFI
jgi:Ring finger domain